jgi:hypothetical protein
LGLSILVGKKQIPLIVFPQVLHWLRLPTTITGMTQSYAGYPNEGKEYEPKPLHTPQVRG